MKSKLAVIILSGFLALQLSGCGVMFGGSRYNATIVADGRPNAEIYVNGERSGQGQVKTLLKRNQPLKVEVKEEGSEPITKNFDNTFRTGNFILSVITWGILGIAVDLGTGASYKPDHRRDDAIEKLSDKDYKFSVNTSE